VTTTQELVPQEDIDLCESMTGDEEALIRDIISRVADKWSLWALSELTHDGPLRFSRLLDRLKGISQKSLTATLRRLERDGFVTRTMIAQVPIRVDYQATHLGVELIKHVDPLWVWAARNVTVFAQARADYDQGQVSPQFDSEG
jgi:DNA-binding HxlR family transcriptional regulator